MSVYNSKNIQINITSFRCTSTKIGFDKNPCIFRKLQSKKQPFTCAWWIKNYLCSKYRSTTTCAHISGKSRYWKNRRILMLHMLWGGSFITDAFLPISDSTLYYLKKQCGSFHKAVKASTKRECENGIYGLFFEVSGQRI